MPPKKTVERLFPRQIALFDEHHKPRVPRKKKPVAGDTLTAAQVKLFTESTAGYKKAKPVKHTATTPAKKTKKVEGFELTARQKKLLAGPAKPAKTVKKPKVTDKKEVTFTAAQRKMLSGFDAAYKSKPKAKPVKAKKEETIFTAAQIEMLSGVKKRAPRAKKMDTYELSPYQRDLFTQSTAGYKKAKPVKKSA